MFLLKGVFHSPAAHKGADFLRREICVWRLGEHPQSGTRLLEFVASEDEETGDNLGPIFLQTLEYHIPIPLSLILGLTLDGITGGPFEVTDVSMKVREA